MKNKKLKPENQQKNRLTNKILSFSCGKRIFINFDC